MSEILSVKEPPQGVGGPGNAEVQRAVDYLWLLTRKYNAAASPLMTAVTAAGKIATRRVLEAAGYEIKESPTGITWSRKSDFQGETSSGNPQGEAANVVEPAGSAVVVAPIEGGSGEGACAATVHASKDDQAL